MTPEEAEKLQTLLRKAANALEDVREEVFFNLNADRCALVADLLLKMSHGVNVELLRDYAERCDLYTGYGPEIIEMGPLI